MFEVETKEISKKYVSFRVPDKKREQQLLDSIIENGIKQALQCARGPDREEYILIDGYKRLRCLERLRVSIAPIVLLGETEEGSILSFLRICNEKSLSLLEQSRFVDELHRKFSLSVTEIAERLECSKAWVSVRLGIIDEMSPIMKEKVFMGKFPTRSYMYTLRQFTRVNKVTKGQIDTFVEAVSGKGLSTRDIDTLARGYFKGNSTLRGQIENGNLQWTLRQMRCVEEKYASDGQLSKEEQRFLQDLELVQKYISRAHAGVGNGREHGEACRKKALFLMGGIISMAPGFLQHLKEYPYDR